MGISLSNKPGHTAKYLRKIRRKRKILFFLNVVFLLLWHYFFSQKSIFKGIRKRWISEWSENTSQRYQILDKQRVEMDIIGTDLEYW